MEIFGYGCAIIIGGILGLLGGGGSILAVPVFYYIFGMSTDYSTAYSLFVVGISSLVGMFFYSKDNLVAYRTGLFFGIPSILMVFLTRKFLIPLIPDPLLTTGLFELSKDQGIMIIFSALMIVAAISMIRGRKTSNSTNVKFNYPVVILEGILVGGLTGLVGAGGGFLIIPALVLFVGLPMKQAVATSLFIISMKSLIGFTGDIANLAIDWYFLSVFSLLAGVGIIIGHRLSGKINDQKLKPLFGWFVLLMGIMIIFKESCMPGIK